MNETLLKFKNSDPARRVPDEKDPEKWPQNYRIVGGPQQTSMRVRRRSTRMEILRSADSCRRITMGTTMMASGALTHKTKQIYPIHRKFFAAA